MIAHSGSNQIELGDCLEKMKDISSNSIDLVLTDLPYGTTRNKWDSIIPLESLWNEFNRLTKDISCVILTASQPFTSKLVMSNIKQFKHEWIWAKDKGSNFLNIKREPFKEHESILIFSKKQCKYNPIKHMRSSKESQIRARYKFTKKTDSGLSNNYGKFTTLSSNGLENMRNPSSIQYFNVEKGLHPTQKPVELLEYLIKTYTNESDLVLDCCAGSGTTAIACINTKRNYICIEKDEKYFEIMRDRISKTSLPIEAFQ